MLPEHEVRKALYCDQVRDKVYILERLALGVHSISMEQTSYMGRPERSG